MPHFINLEVLSWWWSIFFFQVSHFACAKIVWIFANNCRGVSHTPSFSRMRCCLLVHIANGCWLNGYSPPWRAYAIRPYTCSVVSWCGRTNFRCVFVGFIVWNQSNNCRGVSHTPFIFANKVLFAGAYRLSLLMECVFAAMEGVCDTPLHLFGCEGMR